MLAYGWLVGATVLGASIATAALLLWILSRMSTVGGAGLSREAARGARRCVMLFDGAVLVDATAPARAIIDAAPGDAGAHPRLLRHLEARFGPLADALAALEDGERLEREAGGARLVARDCQGLTRIELLGRGAEAEDEEDAASMPAAGFGEPDAHLAAVEAELRLLRAAAEQAPWPIWHTGPDGLVDWANAAYVDRVEPAEKGGTRGWPPPALFENDAPHPRRPDEEDASDDGQPRLFGIAAALDALGGDRRRRAAHARADRLGDATGGLRPNGAVRRLRAAIAPASREGDKRDDAEAWYDCVARTGAEPGAAVHFAIPAAATVRAERTLEQFVQTLTKTFAHLPVGLAVFDSRRGLSLFNPALTDLTTLPVEFLSSRPTLPAFIDALREARHMPEPRDYRSWRERITALEVASAEGTYLETWSLPSGQTWRVSGRPHPDGAIALVFEDITAEIKLTRRFRSELQMGQSVVDAMDEAIAVFTPDGVLTLANEAYARLWGRDPRTTLGDMTATDASRGWMARCEPSPLWGELRDFVGQVGDRAPWSGEARLREGPRLACRVVPLAAGATLVGFSVDAAADREPALVELTATPALALPAERRAREELGSRHRVEH